MKEMGLKESVHPHNSYFLLSVDILRFWPNLNPVVEQGICLSCSEEVHPIKLVYGVRCGF